MGAVHMRDSLNRISDLGLCLARHTLLLPSTTHQSGVFGSKSSAWQRKSSQPSNRPARSLRLRLPNAPFRQK
jgi:hypothetical protein